MVWWEAEGVEVLVYADDGGERVVQGEVGEAGFDEAPGEGDGMGGLEMQTSWESGKDGRGNVGPGVGLVRAVFEGESLGFSVWIRRVSRELIDR